MINQITIENFKSINKVDLKLGRLNVFIGENGAGKSNILEAIAFAGAASAKKLDNEFLTSRGIRVTEPKLMQPAFDENVDEYTNFTIVVNGGSVKYKINNAGDAYSKWECVSAIEVDEETVGLLPKIGSNVAGDPEDFMSILESFMNSPKIRQKDKSDVLTKMLQHMKGGVGKKTALSSSLDFDNSSVLGNYFSGRHEVVNYTRKFLSKFIIFSPENTSLREFLKDGQILPLGINGEGLLKLLEVEFLERGEDYQREINDFLSVFGWFRGLDFVDSDSAGFSFEVRDRYICKKNNSFDIKGANEGFLFLMFYFALFSSSYTPSFFAIDNIDASLNPKLCRRLVEQLNKLAVSYGKQVILTTHNPAVLDGINLDDDQQRLFIISRDDEGATEIRRAKKPRSHEKAPIVKLSEAFIRGSLGGLPKGF